MVHIAMCTMCDFNWNHLYTYIIRNIAIPCILHTPQTFPMSLRVTITLYLMGAVASVFPLVYNGVASAKISPSTSLQTSVQTPLILPLFQVHSVLPFVYGSTFVLVYNAVRLYITDERWRFIVTGAICGEIYSLLGHFVLELPQRLYNMSRPYLVHLVAPVLYACIYGFLVYPLYRHIQCPSDSTPKSALDA